MSKNQLAIITAKDCTPIDSISPGSEDEKWLRNVCAQVDINDLTLKLGATTNVDYEPVASFDSASGLWTAGRYVGEIHFNGRMLRIEPRFGMPSLERWLTHIWGIKFFPTVGEQTYARAWLWKLLAHLWSSRLSRSSRHGLPCVRIHRTSRSPYLKGRIRVRDTGFEINRGSGYLISDYRERQVDPSISSVLVAAHDVLEYNLRGIGGLAEWLSPRAKDLVTSMRAVVTKPDLQRAKIKDQVIRFTPMTELYRSVVELSKSILRHRPASGTDVGKKRVYGVLLDIAEVWEYYVFRLLHESFPQMEVLHTGRDREFEKHLLHSQTSSRKMGKIYPDICIRRMGSSAFDYIIDAKYKAALNRGHYQNQPQREDLYQITSYLAALGKRDGSTVGVLAYPIAEEEQVPSSWQSNSPWFFSSGDIGQVRFVGISVEQETSRTWHFIGVLYSAEL